MHTDNNNITSNGTPRVTVVMGLYNCESTLQQAVESIINQTYRDWELIMCDDASTDGTYQLACRLAEKDTRIKVLQNRQNMGCNMVLNRCIEAAQGEYIAVMDSDDESLPTRLEKEVAVLDNNRQYAIVGTATIHYDTEGDFMVHRPKEIPQPIDIARSIPHSHPCCMIRRKALLEIGGYCTEKKMYRIEDYYMMARLYARGYRGYNLQEALYRYNDNHEAYRRRLWQTRINEVYTYNRAITILRLPMYARLYTLRSLLVGLLPYPIYKFLHCRPWLKKRT